MASCLLCIVLRIFSLPMAVMGGDYSEIARMMGRRNVGLISETYLPARTL